jgi:hypothetical protein
MASSMQVGSPCAACAMHAHVRIRISLQLRCCECVFFVRCSGSALLQQCQGQGSPEALMRGAKHVPADMPYMDAHVLHTCRLGNCRISKSYQNVAYFSHIFEANTRTCRLCDVIIQTASYAGGCSCCVAILQMGTLCRTYSMLELFVWKKTRSRIDEYYWSHE